MTRLHRIGRATLPALAFALPAGYVACHFGLPWGVPFSIGLVALGLVVLRLVDRRRPRWLRLRASDTPLDTLDQLKLMEPRTTAGGVALIAVLGSLTTEPLKGADEGYQSAIVVTVVATAFYLGLCRMLAQDALSAIRHGAGDSAEEAVAQAFGEVSVVMMVFTRALVVTAVLSAA